MFQKLQSFYLNTSKKYPSLPQIVRFVVVGSWNTILYLSILYLLSSLTGIHRGGKIYVITVVAFIIVVTQSYFINKKWTFQSNNKKTSGTSFVQFVFVTVVGQVINSTLVFLLTTYMSAPFTLSGEMWLMLAGAFATSVSMVWNFIGYKIFVFKS